MPSIVSFYQATVPRGKPFVERVSWATGSTPSLTIDPAASNEQFISEIIISASADLVINDTLKFTGWDDGAVSPTDLEVNTLAELLALGDVEEQPGLATDLYIIRIKLHPPLLVTDAGAETLVIENTGGATAVLTGTLEFTVKGWKVLEANH